MDPERVPVDLLASDGGVIRAEFWLGEESPEHPDLVRLSIAFQGSEIVRDDEEFWSALRSIRVELGAIGLRPRCYGSSRNVYPSAMGQSMGVGNKAYQLEMGRQGRMADLVDIFEDGPGVDPASVEEQEAFYEAWLRSLGW